MSYFYTKISPFSFLETIDELTIAFSEEGFWLVSSIDAGEKIRKKVDINFTNYKILGFCQPEIAYEYLSEDMNIWIFLPCWVVVYEKEWVVNISTWLPDDTIWKIVQNKNLENLDKKISEVIKKIINSVC